MKISIFKKKRASHKSEDLNVKYYSDSELIRYTINNKHYAVAESQSINIQSVVDDVSVYGWSLEVRWKWYNWVSYRNRIYVSKRAALEAATKIYPNKFNGYEWRLIPIYKMTVPEFRSYKIDQLLIPNDFKSNLYEIKAWKVKEDYEIKYNFSYKFSKNALIIQMENGSIRMVKNSINPNTTIGRCLLDKLINDGMVDEVDIKNEKWAHPHLCKELKSKIK